MSTRVMDVDTSFSGKSTYHNRNK